LPAAALYVVNGYAKSGRPFPRVFTNAPHSPWEAPGDEAESERIREKGTLMDFDGGTQKTYQRMIEGMDVQIGRVLQALDANRLTENTIVIFTSDNGGERFSDTWPFTGRKTELLEGGLRIPAIVSWPARILQGRTTDQVAITMDWMPTLLAAAGVAPDPAFHPMAPAAAGPHAERSTSRAQAVLALQGKRPTSGARRRLQVPEGP
jgi:arylsulfatase A-like enzyme